MEFLESLATIQANDLTVSRLFNAGDGRAMRSLRGTGPDYQRRLVEAATFMAEVYEGRRPLYHLQEAMTTSDFPNLFGDILDRSMLARYRAWQPSWPMIANRRTARDFRSMKRFLPNTGLEGRLSEVAEQQEYHGQSLTEQTPITYAVRKFGATSALSWETYVNDDLDQFRDIPDRFAIAARRTEEREVTDLYVGSSGPSSTLYTAGNGNIINTTNGGADDNPPLSIAGLQDAMTVLGNMVDEISEPIVIEAMTLVVPPALAVTAENILNSLQIEVTEAGGTANQKLIAKNWMAGKVTLVVNPYIPIVATSNKHTSWFLFATPGNGRPALEIAFLRGHEEPEIFVKSPNAQRVGGGEVNPFDGDFETDSVQHKVRHVLGATTIDAKMTVASNGTGV